MATERKGWPVREWGELYGFGRTKAYQLIKSGQGPRTIRPGGGFEIVTVEADEEWRRKQAEAAERAEAEVA
jgi:hypothetical protein